MVKRTARPGEPARWLDRHLASHHGDECVEWPYGKLNGGYGQVTIDGRRRRVTHVVLEATGRPRPPAPRDNALHSCDNPPCCNAGHLRWGSRTENKADMIRRERVIVGQQVEGAVLTASDVREIRARYAAGEVTQTALAAEYGVAQPTISDVVTRRTWRHLDEGDG